MESNQKIITIEELENIIANSLTEEDIVEIEKLKKNLFFQPKIDCCKKFTIPQLVQILSTTMIELSENYTRSSYCVKLAILIYLQEYINKNKTQQTSASLSLTKNLK